MLYWNGTILQNKLLQVHYCKLSADQGFMPVHLNSGFMLDSVEDVL
jgi:hypothetical protein